ncbi:coadhesin [Exaiptasia diaphana]|uniref:VWFA domain-containing protein n=1 Tax=Exaiptasia diaphana TaxID=2652724 RepID=A0A913XS58_EXADI|nr:coadhesin [Exaiptasia diaphana]KXJ24916.1 Coadhesin [Exaiptasia diaphana]
MAPLLRATVSFVLFQILFANRYVKSGDSCPKLEKIGCFVDTLKPRPLPELLINDRDPTHPAYSGRMIDWYNFDHYLKDFVCRCADKTKARGYEYFGLQFYGECWSGPNGQSRFSMHGPSNKCIMGLALPPMYCNRTSARPCVGVPNTNYIYKIKTADTKSPQDGNWSPWGPWTSCSKTCGSGTKLRERVCSNPPPENGGKICVGKKTEEGKCTIGKCPSRCRRDLDLALVLDSSSSIGQSRYKIAKEFLTDLLMYTQGSIQGTRLAIIVYNQNPYVQITFNQSAAFHMRSGELAKLVRSLPYLRGGTRTDKALQEAAKDIFTSHGGDRYDVPNVLLVLTDGRTNNQSKPYQDALRPLRDRKVVVIAVGVGSGINRPELLQIVMGKQDRVFSVSDYRDLYIKLSDIVDSVCHVN